MNKELRELFDKEEIITNKITIKNNVKIIEGNDYKLVIKRREKDLTSLYKYLKSRSFNYYPEIIYSTNNYDIYKYIEDIDTPKEQRAIDIINLLTMLHGKTTYYKDIDDDTYKELYESILDKLNYLNNYYNDIAEIIESEVYMSPSNYLFIRNISKVFKSLNYSKNNIKKWYKIINNKKRIRIVNIHNNLRLEHYLFNTKPYFISWDKSKKDIPIYDLINLYKNYYSELDFYDILKIYETHYPLLEEERLLFFSLISIPDKLEFKDTTYNMCVKIENFYNYINNTERLINDYFSNKKDKK